MLDRGQGRPSPVCQSPLAPAFQPVVDILRCQRSADRISLHVFAPGLVEKAHRGEVLEPLRRGLQPQAAGQAADGADHRARFRRLHAIHDKGAVDLHFRERKPDELHHGRVAGAEVIDGKSESLHPELRQACQGGDWIAHRGRLRQLQRDALRSDVPLPAHVGQRFPDLPTLQVRGGYVDGDAVRGIGEAPRQPGHRHFADLDRDLVDEIGALRDADEGVGRHRPAHRVAPSQERLEADEATAPAFHLRLVGEPEFALSQGHRDLFFVDGGGLGGTRGRPAGRARPDRGEQLGTQFRRAERLLDRADDIQSVLGRCPPRCVQDARVHSAGDHEARLATLLRERADDLHAVHLRHDEVDDQELRLPFMQRLEESARLGDRARVESGTPGDGCDGRPYFLDVVQDEDA